MTALTDECPIEISAIGIIATDAQRNEWGIKEPFYVLEFYVPDQECTGGSTVFDMDSYADVSLELRDQGISSDQICVWWHSHVNMDTGHSGTDEKQIEEFNFDKVCISVISNKKRDLNVRVDMYNPFRFSFEKCGWSVDQVSILEDGWAKEMVEDHVSRPAPTQLNVVKHTRKYTTGSYTGKVNGHQSFFGHWDDDYIGWDGGHQSKEAGDDKSESASDEDDLIANVEYVKESLRLPDELELLAELYEENIVDLTEVIEYHSKWYAKEMSTEEILDELSGLYYDVGSKKDDEEQDDEVQKILAAEFGEDDEDEDEPVGVAV